MRYRSLAVSLSLVFAVAVAACDTVSDLGEVSVGGEWDGVGALQADIGAIALELGPEGADGSFEGTWRLDGGSDRPVINGLKQDGDVQFTLANFQGESVVFTGRLTNPFRLEGDLAGVELDRPAVFRRFRF